MELKLGLGLGLVLGLWLGIGLGSCYSGIGLHSPIGDRSRTRFRLVEKEAKQQGRA